MEREERGEVEGAGCGGIRVSNAEKMGVGVVWCGEEVFVSFPYDSSIPLCHILSIVYLQYI